jgi:amino acid transporter
VRKLTRQLKALDVFCISTGAMISSGLFVLPGLAFAKVGPVVILAYILAGILIIPLLLSKIELITAMPKAGGSYFFIERSLGSTAGTIGGLACWLSLSLKSAFALVGIGAFASLITPQLGELEIKIIALLACVFFVGLNLVSVKLTGRVQIFLVFLLIFLLAGYIIRGAIFLDVHRFVPFSWGGGREVLAVCGLVFISFGGLTKAASVAEEVRKPGKNIPLGTISAFCLVWLLYGLVVFITVGVLDRPELAHSLTPISTGGKKILGLWGQLMMTFAAMLAFTTTANAGILSASRFPLAMGRDQLLPNFFAQVNKKFTTPHFSIVFTGLFMMIAIAFLNLENLVKVASTMQILLFIFVITSSVIMRESRILNYKPAFISPFYPWLQIAGIISYSVLLYQMGKTALLFSAGFILVSFLWDKFYVRKKPLRKSALVHLVERITDKEIAGSSLSRELGEILKDRDEIIEDRFDQLVKKCQIIDLNKPVTLKRFFTLISAKLAQVLQLNQEELLENFLNREKETTTVIRPGLAIPHLIIEGEHKFELLIVRAQSGVIFASEETPVYAIFILVGTRDERNFHLRALSAIAQITQNPNFDCSWLRAKSIEELRDIILLAQRRREKLN